MKENAKYHRMTYTTRLRIGTLYNAGHSGRFIAGQLDYTPSAICREIKHGLYDHLNGRTWEYEKKYSPDIAQQYADYQATIKGVPVKLGKRYDYVKHVAECIKAGWSPDVIVNRLKKEGKWTVSTSTLYRYIEKGYIPGITSKDLLEKPYRKSSKKSKEKKNPSRAPKGASIEERPKEIKFRKTFGHWEMDTVIGKAKGKKQAMLVLTERKTRYEIIEKLPDKTTKSVVRALARILAKYPIAVFQTITVDNGSEFQDCYGMEHDKHGNRRLTVYYCHPYCSCERGSNERANRIIRRFFPKGVSFAKYTSKHCHAAENWMNNLPRKILDYSTPAELFQQELDEIFLEAV